MAVKDRHVRELFEKALIGGLDETERERFRAHTSECDLCAHEYADAEKAKGWAGLLAEGAPQEAELAKASVRLERTFGWRRSRSRLVGYPVVGIAAAVALVLLIAPWKGTGESSPVFAPAALSAPNTPEKVKEYVGAFSASPLIRIRDVADLSGVTVSGFDQPELVGDAEAGKRVLRLKAQPLGEGVPELTIPAPEILRGEFISSISLRAFSEQGSAVLSLAAGLRSGAYLEAAQCRRIDPGEWKLAVFELDGAEIEAGGGLKEVRISMRAQGPVRIDHFETWCKGQVR